MIILFEFKVKLIINKSHVTFVNAILRVLNLFCTLLLKHKFKTNLYFYKNSSDEDTNKNEVLVFSIYTT